MSLRLLVLTTQLLNLIDIAAIALSVLSPLGSIKRHPTESHTPTCSIILQQLYVLLITRMNYPCLQHNYLLQLLA